jgi:hypothetical protein
MLLLSKIDQCASVMHTCGRTLTLAAQTRVVFHIAVGLFVDFVQDLPYARLVHDLILCVVFAFSWYWHLSLQRLHGMASIFSTSHPTAPSKAVYVR